MQEQHTTLFEKPDLRKLKPALQETVLFRTLSEQELDTVIKYAQLRSFRTDEHVFFEGDKGSALFIVLRGIVDIVRHNHGKHMPIATLKKGMFFGEMALAFDTPRTATALVTNDALLACLFKHDLDQLVKHYPALGKKVIEIINKIIAQRLSSAIERKEKHR